LEDEHRRERDHHHRERVVDLAEVKAVVVVSEIEHEHDRQPDWKYRKEREEERRVHEAVLWLGVAYATPLMHAPHVLGERSLVR